MSDTEIKLDTTPEHDILERQLRSLGLPVVRSRLRDGDLSWQTPAGEACLELKQAPEAVASFLSGRLREQMSRVLQHDLPGLLITGVIRPTEDGATYAAGTSWGFGKTTALRYDALANYLLSLERAGCLVEVLPERTYLASRIAAIYRWSLKERHESLEPPPLQELRQGLRPLIDQEKTLKLAKLMTTTGIGQERAKAILEHFGWRPYEALKALLEGDVKELCRIPGVGRETVERFRREWLGNSDHD